MVQGSWVKSAIIGEVEIVDCVQNYPSVWSERDCWNWIVQNHVMYDKPISAKGKLLLWEYEKPKNIEL